MSAPQPLRRYRVALAALGAASLALSLLLATQAYGEEIVQRQTTEQPRWSEAAAFTYQVPVTRNSTLYPNGTVLPMGEPAYFRTVSPGIPLNFTWRMQDLGRATGNVSAELTLRVQADAGRGRSFWETRHVLDNATSSAPQEGVRLHGYVDLDREVAEVAALLQQMPPEGGRVNWSVEARVGYDVVGTHGPDAGTSLFVFPLDVSDPRIKLAPPEALAWTSPHSAFVTTSSHHLAGWDGVLSSLPALGLLVLGLALGGAAAWAEASDPTRGLGPEESRFRDELAAQKDWVTTASAPLDVAHMPRPMIDVASLEDLVQAAADARTRVVLDEPSRVYYALATGATYRYAAHARVSVQAKRPLRPKAAIGPRP